MGIDKRSGVKITIPGNPYLVFNLTSHLFRLLNIVFDFLWYLHLSGQYFVYALIRRCEKKVKTRTPMAPPIFVKIMVSKNDIFMAYTATGNVAANFHEQKKITVISFILCQMYKY